jgi:hypothetical protein
LKKSLLMALILTSFNAQARQYVQCSYQTTFDSIVLNLNDQQPTLFLTNGVHLPDTDRIHVLKNVNLIDETDEALIYESRDDRTRERVYFPKAEYGRASQFLELDLELEGLTTGELSRRTYSCFSSIYED